MKNILITGCSSGLGNSLSHNKRHNIFTHYRTSDKLSSNSIIGDLNDINFLNTFDSFIKEKNINVFINNAGVYHSECLTNTSDQTVIDLINTNLISPILLTKRICSYFKERGEGTIININSLAGKNPSSNEAVYCASKFGLSGFSKSLQIELIGSGIEIVDLYPGAMKTRMTKHRPNYENLMDPDHISDLIYDIIENSKTYYLNEIVIRRKVK